MTILQLKTQEEYKKYYIKEYCNKQIYTFSGILVKFYKNQFEHAFFESANHQKRDKSIFSIERAKRMKWIKEVLEDKAKFITAYPASYTTAKHIRQAPKWQNK